METDNQVQNVFIPTIQPLFTRYLYVLQDVYWSLLCCIVKNKTNEAIFWAYELYYSGFKKEVIVFLQFIYSEFHESVNSQKVKNFIDSKITEFRIFKGNECLLATIVANMSSRQCDMEAYLLKYGSFDPTGDIRPKLNKVKKLVYIIYEEKDILQYKTASSKEIRNWKILREVCSLSTYKDQNKLIESTNCEYLNSLIKVQYTRDELKHIFRYKWEYYSYFTPVWKERFGNFGASVDVTEKVVNFPDDDITESFYEEYGYEPDEQPIAVFDNCIGV
jgi:hypothetical protein